MTATAKLPKRIEVGQIWREVDTNRFVKILEVEVHGTGPAWTYCDEAGNPEPHGIEPSTGQNHADWFWHYCDFLDFCVFKRFEFVRLTLEAKKGRGKK